MYKNSGSGSRYCFFTSGEDRSPPYIALQTYDKIFNPRISFCHNGSCVTLKLFAHLFCRLIKYCIYLQHGSNVLSGSNPLRTKKLQTTIVKVAVFFITDIYTAFYLLSQHNKQHEAADSLLPRIFFLSCLLWTPSALH